MLLDTLMVKITGDASGLSSATSKAKADINGLAGSTEGSANKISAAVVAKGQIIGNIITSVASKAISAVGDATSAVVGGSLEQYAAYEQNVGGIQKLFGNMGQTLEEYAAANSTTTDVVAAEWQSLEDAQNLVLKNADEAYKTAGVSANTYMETVTSFSAALINSLSGDTQKAAEQAQVAMVAMSDNVNTFGTDMQDVQNAFQGFAKQNYTMLDNLKLGYGGTQEEMKRLISDANEYAASIGQASDLSIESFSDIVTAIDLIQQKQNIAGTTSREAATTIEGSVNTMKAAWENWLAGLGQWDADFDQLTSNLVTSVETAAKNVLPRLGIIVGSLISSLPELLSGVAPALIESLKSIASTALEAFRDSFGDQFSEQFEVIDQVVAKLQEAGTFISTTFGPALQSAFSLAGPIVQQVLSFLENMGNQIQTVLAPALPVLSQAFSDLMGAIEPWIEPLGNVANIFGSILVAAITAATYAISGIIEVVSLVLNAITDFDDFLNGQPSVIGSVVDAIVNWFSQIPTNVSNFLSNAIQSISQWVSSTISKASEAGRGFLNGIKSGFESAVSFVKSIPGRILNALGDVGSLLWNAGSSIINGLLNGIKNAIGGVYDFVSGIAGQIAALKGPIPYDLKLLVPNGQAIMKSLLTGITGGASKIFDYVSDLGGEIADSLSQDYSISVTPELQTGTLGFATANGAQIQYPTATETTNIYINGAKVNDDDDMRSITRDFLLELKRKADL